MTQPTLLELADQYAKEYFMGRGEDARKRLQAAIIHAEVAADKAVTDEREACAVVAENTPTSILPTGAFLSERVAANIRARGKP